MKLVEPTEEAPAVLEVNVVPSRMGMGVWIVETVDMAGDGLVMQTHFPPPFAEHRARDYATYLRFGRTYFTESGGEAALFAQTAAEPLAAAIALYEPSVGEDDDELVEVRLGDLRALRSAHAKTLLAATASPAHAALGPGREP